MKQHFFIIRRLRSEAYEAFLQWFFIINRNLIKYIFQFCVCVCARYLTKQVHFHSTHSDVIHDVNRNVEFNISMHLWFVAHIVRMYVRRIQNAYIKPHSIKIRMNPAIYTHNNNNRPHTVYLSSIWLNLKIYGLLIFHQKKLNTFNKSNGKWWLKELNVCVCVANNNSFFHLCSLVYLILFSFLYSFQFFNRATVSKQQITNNFYQINKPTRKHKPANCLILFTTSPTMINFNTFFLKR